MKSIIQRVKTLGVFLLFFGACAAPPGEEALSDPPTCDDGSKNGLETDIDCGGPHCEPCTLGGSCSFDRDCESERCDEGVCQVPSCSDGRHNGEETDIDCGGPDCGPCEVGGACLVARDCDSQFCSENTCLSATCNDGVQNGEETDVDCGGSECPTCAVGLGCSQDGDCETGYCEEGICQEPPCDEDISTAAQTDAYCGGPYCIPCETGKSCFEDRDCESEICRGEICRERAFLAVATYGSRTHCVLDLEGKIYCSDNMVGLPFSGDFQKIAVGSRHGCGLKDDGKVQCWGANHKGQTEVPTGVRFIDIDLTHNGSFGIDEEFRFHYWGGELDDIDYPPPVDGRFEALSVTGPTHCFLDLEGNALCPRLEGLGYMPSERLQAIQVEAGSILGCALDEAFHIHCWGHPTYDLILDIPDREYVDIAAGNGRVCAIRKDTRHVECWGDEEVIDPVLTDIPDVPFREIVMDNASVCGLDIWDQLHCWGFAFNNSFDILFD